LAKKEQFPRALNNLGALLIKEREKLLETMKGSNLERGIKYLKKATDMMYPKAFLNLGKCFELGLGVKKNHERAKALYI
jgi:TPR repeat protein